MKNIKLIVLLALIFSMATGISGCAVQPWERGNLAKSQMALDPFPRQSQFRSHNYSSREAAVASGTGGGGGCGCY